MRDIFTLSCVIILASCALPRQHSALMRGKVRGGDVPLYVMGGVSDFAAAGRLKPAAHDYYRTEYEAVDMAPSGFLTAASDTNKNKTVAQFAIPLMVSTLMLPRGYKARYALASSDKLGEGSSLLHNLTENVPLRALTPDSSVTGGCP
jgi:hypothetical protein